MTELRIRKATVEDAEAVARLQVLGWQHAYRGQMPQDYLDGLSVERRREQHTQWLSTPAPKSHTLLAVQDDEVVGYCTVGPSAIEGKGANAGHLYAIYLDPSSIGKGVGTALMRESVAVLRAEGFTSATLWVLDSNTKARGFYEHEGWRLENGVTNIEWIGDFRLLELLYWRDLTSPPSA